jgi:cyclopropane-fatty-acyl-phospholipid synthase
VGHHYFDTYFRKCSELLKSDGLMLLQAITISDQAYERHKDSVDFIKRYIFPGSCIPSNTRISRSLADVTDLRLVHLEDIGPHYARTLRHWRGRFLANRAAVTALGFDESFIRMWEFYLAYCEGGFAERYLSDVQMLMAKPLNRREPILPTRLSAAV